MKWVEFMKYLVMLGDGMADLPVKELGDKTPLQRAFKPNIDKLAKMGIIGMVKTVPDHIAPGSDVANMSVLGFDPDVFYTGRSPLEAVSMGIKMSDTDMAIRCNLVTLSESEDYENKTMLDYSSDEITTDEASQLIQYLDKHIGTSTMKFYSGISYRHCLIWDNGKNNLKCTPPHDILDKKITSFLPASNNSMVLLDLMKKSYDLLVNHPINVSRREKGLNPANSIWLWGEGRKPALGSFFDTYNLKGAVVSAVDLIKGLGICAGMKSLNVEGATGNIHTNYEGKAQAAIDFFSNGGDFVFVHVEAPDECGHRYEIDNKVKAIELIDSKIMAPILDYLYKQGDFKVMVLPDHPTPLCYRTHTHDAVPFLIFDNNDIKNNDLKYCEEDAKSTGLYVEKGHNLMKSFLS